MGGEPGGSSGGVIGGGAKGGVKGGGGISGNGAGGGGVVRWRGGVGVGVSKIVASGDGPGVGACGAKSGRSFWDNLLVTSTGFVFFDVPRPDISMLE